MTPLLAIALTLASPPEAAASEPPASLFILVLSGPEVAAPAALEEAARRQIEASTALRIVPRDSWSDDLRRGTIAQCAGDGACFAEALRRVGIDADLLLTLSASDQGGEGGALIGLRLVATDQHAKPPQPRDIRTFGEELAPGVSPARAVSDRVAEVFPPTVWGQVAGLTVSVDQPNAEVLVGDLQPCVAPCRIERLRPGRYPIQIKRSGYLPWTGEVSLVAGAAERVEVSLESEPSALSSNPWFWGAVGLGALAAGAGVAVAATRERGPITICIARDVSLCD